MRHNISVQPMDIVIDKEIKLPLELFQPNKGKPRTRPTATSVADYGPIRSGTS